MNEAKKIEGTDTSNLVDDVLSPAFTEDYESLLKRENILTASEARKIQFSIKQSFKRTGFLQFLLSDLPKIRRFYRRSHLVKSTYLPPRIRINKNTIAAFSAQIQRDSVELTRILKSILQVAWYHLEKRDYNLIVQFNDLCKKIIATTFPLLNYNDVRLLDKLRSLEILYITCLYKSRYPEIIKSSIIHILEKYPEWDIGHMRISGMIERLLSQDITRPTLYGFFLGLNMVKYRRFFEFREIFSSNQPSIINTFDFECSDKTKIEINTHIDKMLKNLLSLLKEREETNRLKRFLPLIDDDTFDFTPLKEFYDKGGGNESRDFSQDKENAILFVLNFYETFMRVYGKLLNGEIQLETGEKAEIFSFDLFQIEIDKMKALLKKLGKYKYSYPNMPMDDFMKMKASTKVSSSPEVEIVQASLELKDISLSIAHKLIDIERKHNPSLTLEGDGESMPLDASAPSKRSLVIPHWNKRIQEPDSLRGESIFKVILDIITLNLLMGAFFQDDQLKIMLIKSNRVNAEIQRTKSILERISNVIQYKKIREKYHLDFS